MTHDPGTPERWAAPWGDPAPPGPPPPPQAWPGAAPPDSPYASPYVPPAYPGYPGAGPAGTGPRRPRPVWFLLPVVVAAVSIAAFAVFLNTHADRLHAADTAEQIGEAGSVSALFLAEGHRYFLFQASDETPLESPACSLLTSEGSQAVPLAPPADVDDWTYDESREWVLIGSFRSPATSEDGGVVCRGLTGDLLVRPDDSTFALLAGAAVLMMIGLGVAVALLVLIVVLRYRSRPRPSVWQPGPYGPYGSYPLAPYGPYPQAPYDPDSNGPQGPYPPSGW
jgi:hypothetical protein